MRLDVQLAGNASAPMQKCSNIRLEYKPTALLTATGGAPSWRRVACGGLVGRWAADVRCRRHRRTTSSRTATNTGTATHGTITCINSMTLSAVSSSPPVMTATMTRHLYSTLFAVDKYSSKKYMKKRETEKNNQKTNISKKTTY